MADRVECEICHATFKDENGLTQHKQAKHPVEEKPAKVNTKKIKNYAIAIIIIGLIAIGMAWLVYSTYQGVNSCKTAPVTEVNIGGHTNLAMHIHASLNILIDGQKQTVPANVGILPGVMRPMHTHSTDNEIHIEGPCKREFKLGEFFQIWGREFSSQCIFDKCTDEGTLTMKVNGVANSDFENYVIKDHDNIVVEYEGN
ncbi:MAG: hypothetical protein Q7S27_00550 [Nanoarchaeota archaeon]|nr:hypothetical protein [Nanoarchaeota archaeon]